MMTRRFLIAAGVVCGVLVLVLAWGGLGGLRNYFVSKDQLSNQAKTSEEGSLPPRFAQRLRDRVILDVNQQRLHAVDQELLPTAQQLAAPRPVDPACLRIVTPDVAPDVLAYRKALPDDLLPMRGFRAPILDEKNNFWPSLLQTARCDQVSLEAAAGLAMGLPRDGLLLTLVRTAQTLGPAYLTQPASVLVERLRFIGFPVDLLSCFPLEPGKEVTPDRWVEWTSQQLKAGKSAESLAPQLTRVPFRFVKAWPDFQVATEDGEHALGLLRMQIGGGYRDGIIPGGTLDLARQLVNALPDVDFLMSVPQTVLAPFESICRNHLTLVRPAQLTLVAEPLGLSAWAQDNGKAGIRKTAQGVSWATLVSRYASKGEGSFTFLPGDTFLAEGLVAAGHPVAQSRLLYQGGNLMAVREPATGRRLLLLGEGVVHGNTALGLSLEQTLEAFRIEFGVDQCVVVPAVSFHIDFDFSVRAHGGKMVAFVNDTLMAARLVLQAGAVALERQRLLSSAALEAIRGAILITNDHALFTALAPTVYGHVDKQGQFPAALARYFRVAPEDAPSENLRCFLVALEVIGSQVLKEKAAPRDPTMRDYLAALRRLLEASAEQVAELRKLNWEIVAVPSMPDLTPSLNYLNGIHDATRFLVPVYGGLYREVDAAALKIFRDVLGPEVKVIPFLTGESQRQHGAIHCAAAAYPRLEEGRR